MLYSRGSQSDYDLWGRVSGDRETWSWNALKPWILKVRCYFPLTQVGLILFNLRYMKHETWTPPMGGRDPTGQYDPQYHGTQGPLHVTLPWSGEEDFDRRVARNVELQKEFEVLADSNDGRPIGVCELFRRSRFVLLVF
jgi:choline dehydrogenase